MMDPLLENLLAGFVDEAQEIYERVARSMMELEKAPAQGPSFDELGQHVQPGIDWSPRLHDPVLQAELHSVLRAAIDELPEEHRATFLLHDVEGLSNPEIAETLQVKPATVKSRVHRARLFLRARLATYADRAPVLQAGR